MIVSLCLLVFAAKTSKHKGFGGAAGPPKKFSPGSCGGFSLFLLDFEAKTSKNKGLGGAAGPPKKFSPGNRGVFSLFLLAFEAKKRVFAGRQAHPKTVAPGTVVFFPRFCLFSREK